MKATFIMLLALILNITTVHGQPKANRELSKPNAIKQFVLSPGIVYSSIQNNNFSSTNWFGVGGILGVGFEKSAARYVLEIGVSIPFIPISASSHDASGNIFNPSVYLTYRRPLNEKMAIGARWDILDYYIYNQRDLGNNQTYNLQSSTLFASLRYQIPLKDQKAFWATINLGLLNFNREGFGFAFSSPQNVLEEGDFNYQDDVIDNPFGFKYYELDFLNTYLNLRTSLGIRVSKRSSFSYEWQMRHFSEIKSYSTTTGQHILKYNFTLIHQ